MKSKYREYQQLNLPNIGKEILEKWESEQSFQNSISIREGNKPFVFF